MPYCSLSRGPRLVKCLCLCGLLAVAGCGTRRVEVSGKATVAGKPLTRAIIFFAPDKDNRLRTIPRGTVDDNGVYHLSTDGKPGAPLGWYKVYVGFEGAKASRGKSAAPVPINRKYLKAETSPLSVEVVAGPEQGAYDLSFSKQ